MMKRYFLWSFLLLSGCQDVEDAPLMERSTFARFYESSLAQSAVAAAVLDDGYILLGNHLTLTDTTGILIRTDERGSIRWLTEIDDVITKSLAVGNDAVYIVGDQLHLDPDSEIISDLVVSSVMIHKVGLNGTPIRSLLITDDATANRTDFLSSSVTFNPAGNLVVLGTIQLPGTQDTRRPFLVAMDPSTFDTLWTQDYRSLQRDYQNGKSLHCTEDGYLIWAAAQVEEQQSFSNSFIAVPFVRENSFHVDNSGPDPVATSRFIAGDLQPSAVPGFGFGVVGTSSQPNGANSNILFFRTTARGQYIDESIAFFDAQSLLFSNEPVQQSVSSSEDFGTVLCATRDHGFVLGGTMITTAERGNGGSDIFLVKVDAFGNPQWNRLFGGSGDETIASITETPDGGLLISGTKDVSGLPAMFLLKTDPQGQIIE